MISSAQQHSIIRFVKKFDCAVSVLKKYNYTLAPTQPLSNENMSGLIVFANHYMIEAPIRPGYRIHPFSFMVEGRIPFDRKSATTYNTVLDKLSNMFHLTKDCLRLPFMEGFTNNVNYSNIYYTTGVPHLNSIMFEAGRLMLDVHYGASLPIKKPYVEFLQGVWQRNDFRG